MRVSKVFSEKCKTKRVLKTLIISTKSLLLLLKFTCSLSLKWASDWTIFTALTRVSSDFCFKGCTAC